MDHDTLRVTTVGAAFRSGSAGKNKDLCEFLFVVPPRVRPQQSGTVVSLPLPLRRTSDHEI
jgi:hypothetical protein